MRAWCEKVYPDWNETNWQDWQRPAVVPPAVPFGRCVLPLQAVKNGVSLVPELVPAERELLLPAWLSLEEHPRLVITAEGARRTPRPTCLS